MQRQDQKNLDPGISGFRSGMGVVLSGYEGSGVSAVGDDAPASLAHSFFADQKKGWGARSSSPLQQPCRRDRRHCTHIPHRRRFSSRLDALSSHLCVSLELLQKQKLGTVENRVKGLALGLKAEHIH